MPNKNSRKRTLADGSHESAQWEHQRQVPKIHQQTRHRAKRQTAAFPQGCSEEYCPAPSFSIFFLFFLAAAHEAPRAEEPPRDLQTDAPFNTLTTHSAKTYEAHPRRPALGPSMYSVWSQKKGKKGARMLRTLWASTITELLTSSLPNGQDWF